MEKKDKKNLLPTLLAKVDTTSTRFRAAIQDYLKFFKDSQGSFKGIKKTYAPRPDTIDEPSERQNKIVVTTVKEKLDWFVENNTEYLQDILNIEATNATGTAKAELKVGDKSFGELSSLELLRLKGFLESADFEKMYANLPVRSDSEIWTKSENEMYINREIYETPLQSGIKKSTEKVSYILEDPNLSNLKSADAYKPQVAVKTIPIELGDYTIQNFSGETSQRERAEILRRRSELLTAVVIALKEANNVEIVESKFSAKGFFEYLHTGK
ncbi:hypothetical protein D0T84_05770 [Dysgonomonas sp. 521]|uniref:DUF7873 family protein n=1 Tax=Dysgonomonas sp. 521 TaxID=2302932 RepID=UPI0013D41099|nr:hypothetical protein [Dysgonomonas sp. 521]NDV94428.1 hypothetical protein [Dysgonomonas sp. 521]